MTIVDARGLSCPQPVMMTNDALSKNDGDITILVDEACAFKNVTKLLSSKKKDFSVEEKDGYTSIVVK